MNRRMLMSQTGIGALVLGLGLRPSLAETFEIEKSESEWKAILTPKEFAVMRQDGTEAPWTSTLLDEHRKGTFNCAACNLALFHSDTKFDSGTGWPSFFDVLPNAADKSDDKTLFSLRTEVHCRRCGAHGGHVFTDGPEPTGLRYCINGVALQFQPDQAGS